MAYKSLNEHSVLLFDNLNRSLSNFTIHSHEYDGVITVLKNLSIHDAEIDLIGLLRIRIPNISYERFSYIVDAFKTHFKETGRKFISEFSNSDPNTYYLWLDSYKVTISIERSEKSDNVQAATATKEPNDVPF